MARVSLISPYASRGQQSMASPRDSALNVYTRSLASALAEKMDVTVIAPNDNTTGSWSDGPVTVWPAFRRGHAFVAFQIAAAIQRCSTRIIHLQHELFAYGNIGTAITLPLGLRYARMFGCRVVTTVHGVIPLDSIDSEFVRRNGIPAPPWLARLVWRSLLRAVCRASDIVHVHESAHKEMLRRQYGVKHRIEVIPHGVPEAAAITRTLKVREALGISRDANVALFFGYFAAYKGLEFLVEAAPELLASSDNLHIIVAGDVPARLSGSALVADIERLKSQFPSRFHALGFVDEDMVPAVYHAADCLLLPYTVAMAASGPMSLAIGYRVPVLLSNVFSSDFPDAPILFEPSKAGVRNALESFFTRPELRTESREFVKNLYQTRRWPKIAERLSGLYKAL